MHSPGMDSVHAVDTHPSLPSRSPLALVGHPRLSWDTHRPLLGHPLLLRIRHQRRPSADDNGRSTFHCRCRWTTPVLCTHVCPASRALTPPRRRGHAWTIAARPGSSAESAAAHRVANLPHVELPHLRLRLACPRKAVPRLPHHAENSASHVLTGHSGQEPASHSASKWVSRSARCPEVRVSRSAKGCPIGGPGKSAATSPTVPGPACILRGALARSTGFGHDNAPWPLTRGAVVSGHWREPISDRDCTCLLRNPGFRLAGLEENP